SPAMLIWLGCTDRHLDIVPRLPAKYPDRAVLDSWPGSNIVLLLPVGSAANKHGRSAVQYEPLVLMPQICAEGPVRAEDPSQEKVRRPNLNCPDRASSLVPPSARFDGPLRH